MSGKPFFDDVNRKLADMFGYSVAEMTNQPLTAFLNEDAQSQMKGDTLAR